MSTVLSTKKLTPSQKQLLLNSGLGFVEYDAIIIDILNFTAEINPGDNLIITSKNAVKALLKKKSPDELTDVKFFCVGEKTSELLESRGFGISEMANYGVDLAHIIISNYSKSSFTYLCGSIRRDELPLILKDHQVDLKEVEVYSTSLNLQKFQQKFEAVLFFSPSGVESFCFSSELKNTTAICIGNTTASEAEKHTKSILIATKPTVENVIVQAAKFFGKTALGGKVENI
ncbi:uroporphyrinogen-III synthase [Antarcticibacterium sp. 1MA-6-2]|uniref:uroporphyrinogen-III synthase n=1 Tax=Antarcticibacterium sp. 1MA-6-2 TaxID=2908210 RepID=UPI001F448BBB|nr:uroporphyrinogen-III synthase [Antarcticibacterium sp. 1MA-6-2]UJH90011.1 uroporphyrinogen-III synthase [Antarcticibacterium sp. 1MA-6-2]